MYAALATINFCEDISHTVTMVNATFFLPYWIPFNSDLKRILRKNHKRDFS